MRLDADLRHRIAANLVALERRAAVPTTHRAAAVAVAVIEEGLGAGLAGFPVHGQWSTAAALILTRRARHLGNHPGQWALPGGRIEPGESAEQAALRELHEEVGLRLDHRDVLGRLDDFVTRSGFAITPVVVWAGVARAMAPNPAEVASIHRVPVAEFMRDDAPLLDADEDSEHPVLRMPLGAHWVAAPTGAILYQFREVCIHGRSTRVAHFEQPLFARK
jgi:8-oxo-dGTP pyrophosphatase MutT (NUDIX family)